MDNQSDDRPATQALLADAQALVAQALAIHSQALTIHAQALTAPTLVDPNNNTDTDERDVDAYKQIANLQDINLHYPFHKLALEEWQRTEEYLSNIISRREGQSMELTYHIYNVVGIFAVVQGVVLTAVSQLTQVNTGLGEVPVCGKIWFPIVLSGFVTAVTIVGILHEYASLQILKDRIHSENQAKREVAKRADILRGEGPKKFKFHLDAKDSNTEPKPNLLKNRIWVIASLLIFTCICILSYFVILCDTGVVRKWDGGLHK